MAKVKTNTNNKFNQFTKDSVVIAYQEQLEIFINGGGNVSILQGNGVFDPSLVCVEICHIPKIISKLQSIYDAETE